MNWLESHNSEQKIHEFPWYLIKEIKEAASRIGIKRIALIGGVVRDTMIDNNPNNLTNKFKDIDLIIEGSASKLGKSFQSRVNNKRLSHIIFYKDYDTVEIIIDGFYLDLASAREEVYEYPGANPITFQSSLENDLKRRDFSINAIAIELENLLIIDLHNGQSDLYNNRLRFLHEKSVSDDPTRIIRAARYASRLSFEIQDSSLEQIQSTLTKWPWVLGDSYRKPKLPPETMSRLCIEMRLLFKESKWQNALKRLQEWQALSLIDKKLQKDIGLQKRIAIASELNADKFIALIIGCDDPIITAKRLGLTTKEISIIKEALDIQKLMLKIKSQDDYHKWSPSYWSERIESLNVKKESIAIAICNKKYLWQVLLEWHKNWSGVKSPIDGDHLIKQGWGEGPEIGRELKRLRAELLDRDANN